jgi:pyruvate formate lyase activating enzyme
VLDNLKEISNLPLVTDIKRHSLEDGPGIRSVVFFKGCPLRCIFCHNPETQNPRMEIAFSARECIRCENCEQACPEGAIDLNFPDRIYRDKCTRCGKCAEVCPGKGLRSIGEYYSVEILTEILLRDLSFYRHSGGGVTLSGGECTLYPEYLCSLLRSLKEKQIHVVLETSGYFDYQTFQNYILPYLDLIYYDIKFADPEVHRKYTGKSNQRIIGNLQRLLQEPAIEVQPRVPLVPGITATRENLRAIIDILSQTGAKDVTLLPYNPMWMELAVNLGRPKPDLPERFMQPGEEEKIYEMFRRIIEERRESVVGTYG